jgi:hypothetical protein
LLADDENTVMDHDQKATILWNSFKERLGKTDNLNMLFDIEHLIQQQDFSHLEIPFSKKEIDEVIAHMPNDKSPGPDGFNGVFMKKCWETICNQFYRLCAEFHAGNLVIQSINTTFIALIPKINDPLTATDYRPISLFSMALKFITKLLANRLQGAITDIVSVNQYGFIKKQKHPRLFILGF